MSASTGCRWRSFAFLRLPVDTFSPDESGIQSKERSCSGLSVFQVSAAPPPPPPGLSSGHRRRRVFLLCISAQHMNRKRGRQNGRLFAGAMQKWTLACAENCVVEPGSCRWHDSAVCTQGVVIQRYRLNLPVILCGCLKGGHNDKAATCMRYVQAFRRRLLWIRGCIWSCTVEEPGSDCVMFPRICCCQGSGLHFFYSCVSQFQGV